MNMKSMYAKVMMVICLGLATQVSHSAEEVPVEHFANLPLVKSPEVSPDGKHIAVMVRNENGYYDVMVTPFDKKNFNVVASLKKAYDRIEYIRWGNNERLLVAASYPVSLAQFRFRTPKLYSIDIKTGDTVQLSRRGSTRRSLTDNERQAARNDADIVSLLKDDPQHILVALPTQEDTGPSVFKVNIYKNTFEKVVTNDLHVFDWYVNDEGDVLLGLGVDPAQPDNDSDRRFWYRESVDSDWKLLREFEVGKQETFNPVSYVDDDGNILVISDYKLGYESLYDYNVKTGEYGEPIFTAGKYDLAGTIDIDDRVVGVVWYEDYLEQHFFDPADAQLARLVEKTFQGGEVFIASSDENRKKLVVGAVKDNSPQKYFLLDLEKGSASFWFSQYPKLEQVAMPEKRAITYESRDGIELHGYLTLPLESATEPPPLVVVPHGGPNARDYRYFDYWAQLLANRGYAVLQPNFRGSTGFGTAYEVMGYREWGKAMQDDVLDAIQWVEENELADTSNMCLVGASYGGYVALTAAVQTPDMFNCFVSIAGISDLEKLTRSSVRLFKADETFGRLIGDPDNADDLADMRAHSAINFVNKVQAPILLIHGDEDTRVKYQQSENFYELADAAGKDVRYVHQDDGTHFLDYGPHRIEAMEAIDEFLKEHLAD